MALGEFAKDVFSKQGLLRATPTVGGICVLATCLIVYTNFKGIWLLKTSADERVQAAKDVCKAQSESLERRVVAAEDHAATMADIAHDLMDRQSSLAQKISSSADSKRPVDVTLTTNSDVSKETKAQAQKPTDTSDPAKMREKAAALSRILDPDKTKVVSVKPKP